MADTESAVRAYAAAKRFAVGTLERWLAQPADGRAALLDLADRLRLGENQFRDIFDDLVAIGARRGGTVTEVLGDADLRVVLARPLGRNEAVKAIKTVLHRLRYPQLNAAEQRLAALGRSLRLPAGVALQLPENMEGEHITITLRGRSARELRAQARALAARLDDPAIEQMFALLDGAQV